MTRPKGNSQFSGLSENATQFSLNFLPFTEGYSGFPNLILMAYLFLNLNWTVGKLMCCAMMLCQRKKIQFFFDYLFGFH